MYSKSNVLACKYCEKDVTYTYKNVKQINYYYYYNMKMQSWAPTYVQ